MNEAACGFDQFVGSLGEMFLAYRPKCPRRWHVEIWSWEAMFNKPFFRPFKQREHARRIEVEMFRYVSRYEG